MNIMFAKTALNMLQLAVLNVLDEAGAQGLRNCDVAVKLKLDFGRTYLTWEILQKLVKEGVVERVGKRYVSKQMIQVCLASKYDKNVIIHK